MSENIYEDLDFENIVLWIAILLYGRKERDFT